MTKIRQALVPISYLRAGMAKEIATLHPERRRREQDLGCETMSFPGTEEKRSAFPVLGYG